MSLDPELISFVMLLEITIVYRFAAPLYHYFACLRYSHTCQCSILHVNTSKCTPYRTVFNRAGPLNECWPCAPSLSFSSFKAPPTQ